MNVNKTNIAEVKENLSTIKEQMAEVKALAAILTLKDEACAVHMPTFQSMMQGHCDTITRLLEEQEKFVHNIECSLALASLEDEGVKVDNVEPIEILGLPDVLVSLLKREAGIYTVQDLLFFRKKDDLTAIHGCGITKAEKIETALKRYFENKNASTVNAEVLGW